MEALNSGQQQDLSDLVETISQLKIPKFKTEMEEALVKVLKQTSPDIFAKTIVLLGDHQHKIAYLTTLYTRAQKPKGPLISSRGIHFSG